MHLVQSTLHMALFVVGFSRPNAVDWNHLGSSPLGLSGGFALPAQHFPKAHPSRHVLKQPQILGDYHVHKRGGVARARSQGRPLFGAGAATNDFLGGYLLGE